MATAAVNSEAAAVSRCIRTRVMRPLPSGTPRGRQGIRVSRGLSGVTVAVVLDLASERKRLTDEVFTALTEAGFTVEQATDSDIASYMTVTRRACDECGATAVEQCRPDCTAAAALAIAAEDAR